MLLKEGPSLSLDKQLYRSIQPETLHFVQLLRNERHSFISLHVALLFDVQAQSNVSLNDLNL